MVRGTRETPTPSPKLLLPCVVPAGAPSWVTSELLTQTIEVWQPYYAGPLSTEDALAMLMSVGQLIRVLSSESMAPHL